MTQILAWGSTYYLPAVLAVPIAASTGWSLGWVIGGLSLGLLAAGVVSPVVGRAIARRGGRPVLAVSAVLIALGLLALGLAPSLPAYIGAWIVIGLGMGAGLYDPAFATLGRLYGEGGRSAITALTLFGGFASTVCWPLSAALESHLGWRGACLAYAGLQLAVSLPIYLFGLPREPLRMVAATVAPLATVGKGWLRRPADGGLFLLIAGTVALASAISTVLSVHLLTILQGKGLALGAAVALGALVGPSQVAARALEMLVARRHHPVWTNVVAVTLVAVGLVALSYGGPILTLAIVLYGAGIGLESIARGTMPLAVFGPAGYPGIMGRIAMPNLMLQAAAPSIGASLLTFSGADGALAALVAAAVCNVALAFGLTLRLRSHQHYLGH